MLCSWVRGWRVIVWVGLVAGWSGGCGSQAPGPNRPAHSRPPPPPLRALSAYEVRSVVLRAQRLSFALPEAKRWRNTSYGSWWGARHRESGSDLELKRWNAGQLVDATDCALEAQRSNPRFRLRPEEFEGQPESTIAGRFRGHWLRRSSATRNHAQVELLAIGFSLRECFALRFRAQEGALGDKSQASGDRKATHANIPAPARERPPSPKSLLESVAVIEEVLLPSLSAQGVRTPAGRVPSPW